MSDFNADLAVNANDQKPDNESEDTTLDDGDSNKDDEGQDDSNLKDDDEQAADNQDGQGSEDDSETPDDKGDDEPLEFDSWKKQYDLPDDIKSEDDLAKAFAALQKSSTPEIDFTTPAMQQIDARLKAEGLGGVQAFLASKAAERSQQTVKEDQPEPFFTSDPFSTNVESMIKNGMIKSEDAGSYQTIARLNDQVMNPIMKKMMLTLSSMSGIMLSNRKTVNDLQFNQTTNKLKGTGVTREQLDEFMRTHNETNYDSAILMYAAKNDPSILGKIQANAEERGENKAKKKLKRSTSMKRKNRGGTPGSGSGFDHKKYANSDGSMNDEVVNAIADPHKALKVIDQYEKWFKTRKTA